VRILVAAGVIKPGENISENQFNKDVERVAYEHNVSMETARHVVIHEQRFRAEVERRKNSSK